MGGWMGLCWWEIEMDQATAFYLNIEVPGASISKMNSTIGIKSVH
jgi:hypothetical protein